MSEDMQQCTKCKGKFPIEGELKSKCPLCGEDSRLYLTLEQESNLLDHLDSNYRKARVDDLK